MPTVGDALQTGNLLDLRLHVVMILLLLPWLWFFKSVSLLWLRGVHHLMCILLRCTEVAAWNGGPSYHASQYQVNVPQLQPQTYGGTCVSSEQGYDVRQVEMPHDFFLCSVY